MSSQDAAPGGQTPEGHEEKEKQADSPRGRAKYAEHASFSEGGPHRQTASRSVSRGRTHAKQPPKDRRGRDNIETEGYMYPGVAGNYAPRGRRATISEAFFLSDAPHLDYKSPVSKKRRISGAVKSPSHIKMELDAAAEMAGADSSSAAGKGKGKGKASEEGPEMEWRKE